MNQHKMNEQKWWVKKLHKIFALDSLIGKFIVNSFHIIWYHSSQTWQKNEFLGYPIYQCPLDLQLYQEIIFKIRPNFIIQTGVADGGSLLYFASIMDLAKIDNEAKVIGIDIKLTEKSKTLLPINQRIILLEGDSISNEIISKIKAIVGNKKGMVSLDSDHTKRHVLKELMSYREFVDIGSYMVVEDTNLNFHPVHPYYGDGPYEAVKEFLSVHKNFVSDTFWRRNGFSFHQHGWLKRIF